MESHHDGKPGELLAPLKKGKPPGDFFKNLERTTKKKLEADAIEDEIQSRLSQYKTGLEAKIVKKAISIKKRQIKKEAALDEISDDETPIKKIKEIAKRIPIPPPIEQPKYLYV